MIVPLSMSPVCLFDEESVSSGVLLHTYPDKSTTGGGVGGFYGLSFHFIS